MAVPKLRFKEFDEDWTLTTLNQLSTKIGDGIHATPKYDESGTIPFINGNNLVNGRIAINENTKRISSEEFQKYNQILSDRTLFLSINGTIGNLAFYKNEKVLLGKSVCFINLKNDLDKKFIYLLLQSPQLTKTLNSELTGTTIKNLSLATVRNSEFYCPIEAEQTKIASFLSAVDEKISQLTQKHELLSQYKQGMMQKLFSQEIRFKADDGSEFGEWEKIKFLDLMVDLWDYRGKTPKKLGMDWGDGEIQSLSALNIKKGFIDFDADCHLGSEKLYKTWMNKGDLEKDDIIFTMEAPLGNVALIPDDRKYILSQRVVCFKTNKKMIDNKFIFQLILSDQFQSRIEELATGTTAKGINQKSMQKIEVTLPPKDEQTKIASFLSAIDQKVDVVAQQIEQAKQWKKGLLQQMFV